jgi:hypothetical protein
MAKLRNGTRIYGSLFIDQQSIIGTGSSTGTSSQNLQVTGGGYVSGNVGIGSTNPSEKLSVVGNVNVSQNVTATAFYGDGSTLSKAPAFGGSGQVQYNSAGISSGASFFYFDNTNNFVGVGTSSPAKRLDVTGAIQIGPGTSVTPTKNGDVVFEFTNNTTITIRARGTDGTVRSGTITLTP